MKILSVNLRKALETLQYKDQSVQTGINKQPDNNPVEMTLNGLEGDSIGDKKHHGGEFKAVYSYAAEHYDYWKEELKLPNLAYGTFGENLTTQGLDEDTVHIGDQFQVGEAIIQATEPRQPCRVLGMNVQDMSFVKRFLTVGKMGIYYKVIQPGKVKAGDSIFPVSLDPQKVPIREITRLHTQDRTDIPALDRILKVVSLPPDWKEAFQKQLKEACQKAGIS